MLRHISTAALAGLALAALPASANAADYVTQKFDQRGVHQFVVPDGVRSLEVNAIGEQGGNAARSDGSIMTGGWGGDVTGTVFVTAKRTYWVEVGFGGSAHGKGRWPGGRGGGASAFRECAPTAIFCKNFATPAHSRVIVAGGGGGAAGGNPNTYGRGGSADRAGGTSEPFAIDRTVVTGGQPGTQSAGGMPGRGPASMGAWGDLGQGGDAASGGYAGGGGGGGGFYGGGGGGASPDDRPIGGGGGGGGANHVGGFVQRPVVKTATATAPSVTLKWLDDVSPTPFIATPADGDTTSLQPVLRGKAGTAIGDGKEVVLTIMAGPDVVQTLLATRDDDGNWSAQLSPLAPGTYTAVATQRDSARNQGTSSVTFRVVAPAPVPTPTPAPAKPQTAPAPAPVAAAPQTAPAAAPAAAPRIRIKTRRARVTRGTLSLRLKCTGTSGTRCSGRLTLTAKAGKRTVTLGSVPYVVTARRMSIVRVPIRAAVPARRATATAVPSAKAPRVVRTIALR